MNNDHSQRGLFFDEFTTGFTIVTAERVVTRDDILSFAGLTGDWTALHTDPEYAARTRFGRQIAHGTLGLSIAIALAIQTGFLTGTLLAFREIDEWVFRKPIFIDDAIHARIRVHEVKPVPPLGGGLVTFVVEVQNQAGEIVQQGTWRALVMNGR